jgi:hypothetical protein
MPECRHANPIMHNSSLSMRDHQIIRVDDVWYMTGTSPPIWRGCNPGVRLLVSRDLLNWSHQAWPSIIAIHSNDHRCSHQLRTRRGTETDRALRKDDNGISDENVPRFSTSEGRRGDIGKQHDLLVGKTVGDCCEIGLCIRHQKIFSLCAVDRITKSPVSDRLVSVTVAALR